MKKILVAAASINTTPLDWEGNLQKILSCINAAQEQECSILCLPELCITGYGCEDMFNSIGVLDKAWEQLHKISTHVPETLIVSVGLPVQVRGAVYNCVATVSNTKILGLTAKKHLAGDGVHYEQRQFKAWPEKAVDSVNGYPVGDLSYVIKTQIGEVHLGYEICEDAWVADRPGMELAKNGVDIILNPSASHFSFGKSSIRERFVLEGSRAFCCAYIYSNLLGNEAGRIIYDGGNLIAQNGELVARGTRLSFKDYVMTYGILDLQSIRHTQASTASRIPQQGINANVVFCQSKFTPKDEAPSNPLKKWEKSPSKEEEFSRAISLGLFDYMRKTKTKGFTISLSGGADSAAVACLVHLMHRLAIEDGNPIQPLNEILTTVYQASENSGEITRLAAEVIATACGAEHHFIDISSIIQTYTATIEQSLGRPLNWNTDDLTLQNIQARSRAPSIWMMANIKNQLLLTTSNRSEAAVGYATMDGDTCGVVSPISGINKHYLWHWLSWLMVEGLKMEDCVITIPEIHHILLQKATAELRPSSFEQSDEDDLMPYEVLDAIEDLAIGKKLTHDEIIEILSKKHPKENVILWTEKFFRLWKRNQWKRERYAPGLHVDDKNLDPRSWCRYPILSGGEL